MNLRGRKRIALFLVLLITFTFAFGSFADASTASVQGELNSVEQQQDEVSKEISEVTEDIRNLQKEVEEINDEMSKTASDIKKTEVKISNKKSELSDRENNLNERLRAMYKNGSVGFIDILLGSGSISELISNMEMVQRIYANDVNVLSTLQDEHEELQVIKDELDSQKAQLAKQQKELDNQKEALDTKKSELEAKEDQLEADAKALEDEIERLQAEAEAKRKAEEEARRKAELENKNEDGNKDSNKDKDKDGNNSDAVDNSVGTGVWMWPCPSSHYITSYFGYRMHPVLGIWKYHSGMDIGANTGASIVAVDSGTVIMSQWYGGYGNCVIIDHGDGLSSLYGHASEILVSVGDTVSRGETIALIGSTGISSGPHLHLEARVNGEVTDPLDYL